MDYKTTLYQHIVTEGTHYEIGRALGAIVKQDPPLLSFLSSPFMGADSLLPDAVEHALNCFERYCPGINDEVKGFAHETGIREEEAVFYYSYLQPSGHCSQAAMQSGRLSGSRTYHLRTYEYGWEDAPYNQLLLSTTRVTGKPAHIGFALQLFGRYDGMNDQGLSVTTTSGRIRPDMSEAGFVFPGVVRALLDQCVSVKEAVSLMRSMPISDYRNFLVSDAAGGIALIEVAGTHKEIKLVEAAHTNSPQLVVSANHYTLPSMMAHNLQVMHNSKNRYDVLQSALSSKSAFNHPLEAMKNAVSYSLPQGVCCHHYSEGFGTLWSMVFDNTGRQVHICMGSPRANPWISFGFGDPPGLSSYTAILPNETSEASFWSPIP
ncbi:hypothetical protein C2I18_27895 [Paenibacillus sp. PK3_47]|uniref:C45 family autoproteolytic acyltransferase/hydolase n=1 Tax=Paenibacillus sp. PK3_47 TaxID=2072642 RepID=UPI00201D41EB|nr:C45 family peptidase [Paenibacillus sp. PK3_47]UQZ37021.1 hypothetical protein C2I18_27895 [Paenibacillus sp. PK3_47]